MLDRTPYRGTAGPYYLTHATEEDVDHRIEVLLQGSDPADEDAWLVLPPAGSHGSDRYRRYQHLANVMSAVSDDEGAVARIAQSIGAHFAGQRNITPQQVRCRKHMLQPIPALQGGTKPHRKV